MFSNAGISRQVTGSQLSSVLDNLSFTKAINKRAAKACFVEWREESGRLFEMSVMRSYLDVLALVP